MIVRPVEEQDVPLIHEWLSSPDNVKWLDFAETSLLKVKFMLSRPNDLYRIYAPDRSHPPIGIAAVVNINPVHRQGVHWVILGDKAYSGQGYSSQAASEILQYAFSVLKLNSISTYVVESNHNPLVVSSGFRYYGRERQCHLVDGTFRDRLCYNLLSTEFKPLHYREVEAYDNARVEAASR
jgi:RimJ/RimL family protein N-acetyltransferase